MKWNIFTSWCTKYTNKHLSLTCKSNQLLNTNNLPCGKRIVTQLNGCRVNQRRKWIDCRNVWMYMCNIDAYSTCYCLRTRRALVWALSLRFYCITISVEITEKKTHRESDTVDIYFLILLLYFSLSLSHYVFIQHGINFKTLAYYMKLRGSWTKCLFLKRNSHFF